MGDPTTQLGTRGSRRERAALSFHPLVGRRLGGASLTPWNDHAPGTGALGRPVWGEAALLRDLELRLGLPSSEAAPAVREQAFAARLDALASHGCPFWLRSYEVDPVGTAAALLAWRDQLVDAGWDGWPIPHGGPRLEALSELAVHDPPPLPPGRVDRLERVEHALRTSPPRGAPYDAITLAEPRALWSARWRRVLKLLEPCGTVITGDLTCLDSRTGLGQGSDTDLAHLQALVRGESVPPRPVRGDGSVLLLRAPTSWELGETVAAWLRANAPTLGATVVIAAGEHTALASGLAAQGLPSLGVTSSSAGRPALQVLPLAVELAFEPRDPYRVLELLTLPLGPFSGMVGRELARALADAPGIGGRPWRNAKQRLLELATTDPAQIERRLESVATWLESPGVPQGQRAPRARLLEVAGRVEEWLRRRRALAEEGDVRATFGAAYAQARAFIRVLAEDVRADLSRIEARALVDRVTAGGLSAALADESAGRFDHAAEPGALLVPRDTVVFWHAVRGTERSVPIAPWRAAERTALAAAGVELPDLDLLLGDENDSWRNAVRAARSRIVLAVPDKAAGSACAPHPLWEEIVARLDARGPEVTLLTRTAWQLRADTLPLEPARVAPLPPARLEWRVPAGDERAARSHSATSLEALLRCPLGWVLQHALRLRSGAVASLPPDHMLAGKLGHRLIERLHEEGGLGRAPDELEASARALLHELLPEEGATWLLPGRSFEREQTVSALVRAAVRLAESLAASGLTVDEVEQKLETAWGERELHGRADLLARDASDRRVVVDLKWGASHYRKLLEAGLALQLAVYARAAANGRPVPAGYFSLKQARFYTTEPHVFAGTDAIDAASAGETIDRAERTLALVEAALAEGRVLSTGLAGSLPLPEALGVPAEDRAHHLDFRRDEYGVCGYCSGGPICGKAWEGLR